jgi:hypothetical protein
MNIAKIATGVVVVAAVAIGLAFVFKDTVLNRMSFYMHSPGGMGHDMKNMPGLRGANASHDECDDLAFLFENFDTISREVTNLPNGIRTVYGRLMNM